MSKARRMAAETPFEYWRREPGTIVTADYREVYNGIMSVFVYFKAGDGFGQGMGSIKLDDGPLKASYIADLCAAFGVHELAELVGQKCHALYAFKDVNPMIEAFEGPRGVFSVNAWQRKHFPETPDLVTERRRELEEAVRRCEEEFAEARMRLIKFKETHGRGAVK